MLDGTIVLLQFCRYPKTNLATVSAGTPGLFTLCEHFPHSRLLTVKELNKLLKKYGNFLHQD